MYPTRNLTARVHALEHALVLKAAKRAGKSVSEYIGECVVPFAADDLGVEVPDLPRNDRGRHRNMVEEAAVRQRVTPKQFESRAAELIAFRVLGEDLPPGSSKERGWLDSVVRLAARLQGKTVQQFKRHSGDILAAETLGMPSPIDVMPEGESSDIPAAKGARTGVDIDAFEKKSAARKPGRPTIVPPLRRAGSK